MTAWEAFLILAGVGFGFAFLLSTLHVIAELLGIDMDGDE